MQNSNSPAVSILVPSFNEDPATVEDSFRGIRDQTWPDFECLVIDESTDPHKAEAIRAECAKDVRFRYIRPDSRIGLAGSLNLGLAQSRGGLIARCDSDDVCLPDRLTLQVRFLEEHPEVGIVGGAMEIIDDSGTAVGFRKYPQTHKAILKSMMFTNAMAHPTVLFRRDITDLFGAYDPAFRYSEDLELWLRWLNAGVIFANLPDTLLKYRQQVTVRHSDNWSYNLKARRRNYSSQYLALRVVGMAGIAVWSVIPASLQEYLFRILMFRRK